MIDRLQEYLPDKMSDRMPDRMTEYNPDQILDRMPEGRWNVRKHAK
jgi:hypothetical protein